VCLCGRACVNGNACKTGRPICAGRSEKQKTEAAPPRAVAVLILPHPLTLSGDDPLSKFVNLLISSPLYPLMKVAAKSVLKKSAEDAGVDWSGTAAALKDCDELYEIMDELRDPTVTYPDYYTQPFHAYDAGNLSWEPAREVEAATAAMGLRTWKGENLDPLTAQAKLRQGILDGIAGFAARTSARPFTRILDVGCSAGVSSRSLADAYPAATVTGLDLSPYFLAVAELRERQLERGAPAGPLAVKGKVGARPRITYLHANAERCPFPDGSFDLVTSIFTFHELRPAPIDAVVADAARLLAPGGVLAVADNDPASKTIQNLPPALFTLMKSTEPWSDEYYCHDLEDSFRRAGLESVTTVEADHRHRVVLGRKPGQ
jgi:ubiquinone/menaquinone biosynthesis C-methylase UbiE